MSYQDNVRAAAAALQRGDDANWELARLTYEVCGPTGHRGHDTRYARLETWAQDVASASGRDLSTTSFSYYRKVWERFGFHSSEIRMSWTDAYNEMRGVENMDANMVSTNFNRFNKYATPEQKREALTTLVHEPEVLDDQETSTEVLGQIVRNNPAAVVEAWKDTNTNIGLSTARWEARTEQDARVRAERQVIEPKDATLDRRVFLADVATKVEQWTRELDGIREFLELSDDVDRIRRWATRQALERLVDAASACRDALPVSYAEQAEVEVPVVDQRRLA